MPKVIRVAVLPASLADRIPLSEPHPGRILIDFAIGKDGLPVTPMRYTVTPENSLLIGDVRQIYRGVLQGAEHADHITLADGIRYAVLHRLRGE